jgi:hypothetical protein
MTRHHDDQLGDMPPLAFIAGGGNRHQICGKKDPVAAIGLGYQ